VPGLPKGRVGVSAVAVTPDYFKAFSIEVVHGRAQAGDRWGRMHS
jgi:hypothetical protein